MNVYLHVADEGTACLLLAAAAVDEDEELTFLAGLCLASCPGRNLPRFRFTLESIGNDDCVPFHTS